MKKRLIRFFVLSSFMVIAFRATAQYIHFNEVYRYDEDEINTLPIKTLLLHDKYYNFGSSLTSTFVLSSAIMVVSLDGEPLNYVDNASPTIGLISPGGHSANAAIMLSDSSVVTLNLEQNVTDCPTRWYFGLSKFVDTAHIWTYDYEVLNGDCSTPHDIWSRGVININDSTFMVYAQKTNGFGNNPTSWGSIFTYFNYDGEVISTYEHLEPDEFLGTGREIIIDIHELPDKLLCLGSNGAYPHMIALYDYEANMLDSIELGDDTFPNMAGTGTIMNDGYLLYVYPETLDHNLWLDPFVQEVHAIRVDTDDLSIVSDIPVPAPIDGLWAYGISIRESITTSTNDMLLSVAYSPDGEELSSQIELLWKLDSVGNVIWQNTYEPNIPFDYHEVSGMLEAPDGGFLISGVILAEGYSKQKAWLLKIDACGYEQPSSCPPVTGIQDSNIQDSKIELWPNPFYNQLKAVLPQNTQRVFISDATGRIVFEEKVFYPNQTWNLGWLSAGVYVINAELENGQKIAQRIVKQQSTQK